MPDSDANRGRSGGEDGTPQERYPEGYPLEGGSVGPAPSVGESSLVEEAGGDGRSVSSLDALADEVYVDIGNPVDPLAVSASLETSGWRDEDAQGTFDKQDIFTLGAAVYPGCKRRAAEEIREEKQDEETMWDAVKRFLRQYGNGLFFASPMVGQIAAILILGYSLWSWLYFSQLQATAIAIGTIGSLIVTGGFVQSIGLEGTHYLSGGNGILARKSCLRIAGWGALSVLVIAAAVLVLNAVFPFYPNVLMAVSMTYFLLLSALWLLLSLIYVLDRLISILVITLLAIIPVYLVITFTTWGIYAAHALGLVLAIVLATAYSSFWLWVEVRNTPEDAADFVPASRTAWLNKLAPFFTYGVLYFTMLLTDRLVAWSTSSDGEPLPYFIWFRNSYELGMDWALVSLLLTLAVVQYAVHDFAERLVPIEKSISGHRLDDLNEHFQKRYYRYLLMLLVVGAVSVIATYLTVNWLEESELVTQAEVLFSNDITPFVFWWAAFAYQLLAVGLLNTFFFFTLNRPGFALRALAPAFAMDVIVGLLLSRWFGHEYAVIGLAAGALLFAVLSTLSARKFFDRFDYYYYSAY